MRKLPSYFGLQLKRAARLLPRMLAVTLLLAVLSAMSALILTRLSEDDASQKRIRIGVAGDSGEEILSQALDLLQSVDSSRFSVGFVRMEEAEGRKLLEKGELSGLVLFPDGFAQALQYGEHRPVTYLTNTAGSDVGSLMTRELVASISSLILETENAVYGAQALVQEQLPDRDPYRAGDQLVTRYASAILDRARLYALELPQAGDSLSLAASYLCGLSLVFVLLWSVSCSPGAPGSWARSSARTVSAPPPRSSANSLPFSCCCSAPWPRPVSWLFCCWAASAWSFRSCSGQRAPPSPCSRPCCPLP